MDEAGGEQKSSAEAEEKRQEEIDSFLSSILFTDFVTSAAPFVEFAINFQR